MQTLKAVWFELKHAQPGERFAAVYRRHERHRRGWTRGLCLLAAVISFAIGVVLAFIPGPAVVFFAITGALLATQSLWVATHLDATEQVVRKRWHALREWWQKRRAQVRDS